MRASDGGAAESSQLMNVALLMYETQMDMDILMGRNFFLYRYTHTYTKTRYTTLNPKMTPNATHYSRIDCLMSKHD